MKNSETATTPSKRLKKPDIVILTLLILINLFVWILIYVLLSNYLGSTKRHEQSPVQGTNTTFNQRIIMPPPIIDSVGGITTQPFITTDNTPVIMGHAMPGSTVTLIFGTESYNLTLDVNGYFSFKILTPLSPDTYSFSMKAEIAGNVSDYVVIYFTVISQFPEISPTITPVITETLLPQLNQSPNPRISITASVTIEPTKIQIQDQLPKTGVSKCTSLTWYTWVLTAIFSILLMGIIIVTGNRKFRTLAAPVPGLFVWYFFDVCRVHLWLPVLLLIIVAIVIFIKEDRIKKFLKPILS